MKIYDALLFSITGMRANPIEKIEDTREIDLTSKYNQEDDHDSYGSTSFEADEEGDDNHCQYSSKPWGDDEREIEGGVDDEGGEETDELIEENICSIDNFEEERYCQQVGSSVKDATTVSKFSKFYQTNKLYEEEEQKDS